MVRPVQSARFTGCRMGTAQIGTLIAAKTAVNHREKPMKPPSIYRLVTACGLVFAGIWAQAQVLSSMEPAAADAPTAAAAPSGGVDFGTFGGNFETDIGQATWSDPDTDRNIVGTLTCRFDAPQQRQVARVVPHGASFSSRLVAMAPDAARWCLSDGAVTNLGAALPSAAAVWPVAGRAGMSSHAWTTDDDELDYSVLGSLPDPRTYALTTLAGLLVVGSMIRRRTG